MFGEPARLRLGTHDQHHADRGHRHGDHVAALAAGVQHPGRDERHVDRRHVLERDADVTLARRIAAK